MRVKRFVGENVAETMGKVKRDLGPDAVILQTRQFREGGIFGLFSKVKVEITAAIEEIPASKKLNPQPSRGCQGSVSQNQSLSGKGLAAQNFSSQSFMEESVTSNLGLASSKASQTTALETEIQSMRRLLEKMNKQMDGIHADKAVWPDSLQRWANLLSDRGLSEFLVNRLIRQVQQTLAEELWQDENRVKNLLQELISQICSNTAAIQPGVHKPRVVALIGPTGVGKTTTIGKLAAGFSIVDKRKVALITADTYRVAAVEQIKTFGEIIGVPVEVVMTPSGLREAISVHSDKELIFIDTAGRSPHHELHMAELRAFIDKAQPDLTMLVMSATTHPADQRKIFERFKFLATHLIFTKLDETVNTGAILNLLDEAKLPTAYITNGQNVPDDIELATPERLIRYILGEGRAYA
ncbi:MAG: flagellar biosynthesis protein FlhF [Desulfitobacterium hafniense]|nr:flagellar biosynthesis protein FlhF [Desulfitobacterium hafniense]